MRFPNLIYSFQFGFAVRDVQSNAFAYGQGSKRSSPAYAAAEQNIAIYKAALSSVGLDRNCIAQFAGDQ